MGNLCIKKCNKILTKDSVNGRRNPSLAKLNAFMGGVNVVTFNLLFDFFTVMSAIKFEVDSLRDFVSVCR